MTDNEIIETFENNCNSCENCPYHIYSDCDDRNRKDILDLIKRQQAEVEKLQNLKTFENFIIRRIHGIGTKYECDFATKEARDEAFEKELNKLFDIATAKAEAIKEFAERLKGRYFKQKGVFVGRLMYADEIDNLVKEMTEPSLLDKKIGGEQG